MRPRHPECRAIEVDLVGAATGDAGPEAAGRVREHVGRCAACRDEFDRYRAIESALAGLRVTPGSEDEARARASLEARLADLRSRILRYRIFGSPLGNILIACSEHGVSLVEYLGNASDLSASRLARASVEAVADGAEIEALHRELVEYLEGRRDRLDWPIDLRLARGDFDRLVLEVTSGIPYGAVRSYAGLAREIGKPTAARAVAQALRWNPLPLAIPCHRVVGSSGALVGYAGNKVALKQRLLAVEGVGLRLAGRDCRVAREAMYVCRRGDREYCLPTCGSLPSLTLADLTLYASRQRAEAAGLAPCTTCRPDLHAIGA
jgi:methylated-DNA-[protein]-cysteine S-methyltransferase